MIPPLPETHVVPLLKSTVHKPEHKQGQLGFSSRNGKEINRQCKD